LLTYVASQAGAGNVGTYARVAMIMDGNETWRSEKGSHPYNGIVGEIDLLPGFGPQTRRDAAGLVTARRWPLERLLNQEVHHQWATLTDLR
jgi:hypothetical protein